MRARYAHTNVVARDWRALAARLAQPHDYPGAGPLELDPEGNVIELQRWGG